MGKDPHRSLLPAVRYLIRSILPVSYPWAVSAARPPREGRRAVMGKDPHRPLVPAVQHPLRSTQPGAYPWPGSASAASRCRDTACAPYRRGWRMTWGVTRPSSLAARRRASGASPDPDPAPATYSPGPGSSAQHHPQPGGQRAGRIRRGDSTAPRPATLGWSDALERAPRYGRAASSASS